ncbi:MAG TPA: SRPBCC family protein [Phototrophicaceae bacterium]|jgi:uncharacterized membrane protein|nr:SRPBCC family protein [Phototrophicaceae bacterium]
MPYVEKSIEIDMPVETVFRFVAQEPERMPAWWPPIELQERVSAAPTGIGSVSRYVYNMVGIRIKGEHRVMDMVENRHLLVKTISGIEADFDFTFAALGDNRTQFTIHVNYGLPGTILGQLLNRMMIERRNSDELEQGLRNLKKMLESARV